MNNKKIKNENSKTVDSSFANFNYVVVPSPLNGFKEVRVMFAYLGKPITRHLFIEENGNKNNDYYIAEAKKRINQEISDGTLLNESKRYTSRRLKTPKASKVAIVLTSAVAVGCASFVAYTYLKPVIPNYTVTFDTDGGSSIEAQTVKQGNLVKEPEETPTKLGYTFGDWFDKDGTAFDFKKTPITDNTTIYAHWIDDPVNVKFDFSNMVPTPSPVTVPILKGHKIEAYQIPTPPNYDGHTFDGWYTTKEEGDTKFNFENPITEKVTAYARWTANEYTVTYDAKGGTSDRASDTVKYGKTIATAPTATRTGYEATTDWYIDDTHKFNFGTTKVTSDMTLFCKWEGKEDYVTVKFDSNYESGSVITLTDKVQKGLTIPSGVIPTLDPREGYTFAGWYKESSEESTEKFNFSDPINTETTIYAHWTANEYTVTYDAKGGTSDRASDTVKYGKTIATAPTATRTGYEATTDWYIDDTHKFNFGTTKVTSDMTLFCKWEGKEDYIKVTFNSNYTGGEVIEFTDKVQKGLTIPSGVIPTLDPREGYTFAGWYKESSEESTEKFNFSDPINTETTVYAHWTATQLSISIDPNGGKFNDDSTSIKQINCGYGQTWSDIKTNNPSIAIKTAPAGHALTGCKYEAYRSGAWTELADTDVITTDLLIRVTYDIFKTTLKFDPRTFATMPADKEITYGTRWGDIKNECLPTNVTEGYTFVHYTLNDTVIDDNYVFTFDSTTTTLNITSVFNVRINFINDPTKGTMQYMYKEVELGKKWGDVKEGTSPTVIDPTIYQFAHFQNSASTAISDDYIINGPETFTAVYEFAAANNFKTDSWEVFTNYIEGKSFSEITAEGSPYYDEYISTEGGKQANTFVGLTRTINVYGKDYSVRVIDEAKEGHATLTNGHLFTFEFTNLLDLDVPYSFTTDNNNYKDSYVNKYLNHEFLHALPTVIQNAIGVTNVKHYDPTDETIKSDLQAKVFVLSASELGFKTFPDYGSTVSAEGTYAYYQTTDETVIRPKTLLGSESAVSYWTRSADISGGTQAAWNVNTEGTLGEAFEDAYYPIAVNTGGIYIAPAFEM